MSEPTQPTKSMMASDPATTPVREWLAWCAELVSLGGDRYGPRGVVEECGSECWIEYFEIGYSPLDALAEDASYD